MNHANHSALLALLDLLLSLQFTNHYNSLDFLHLTLFAVIYVND